MQTITLHREEKIGFYTLRGKRILCTYLFETYLNNYKRLPNKVKVQVSEKSFRGAVEFTLEWYPVNLEPAGGWQNYNQPPYNLCINGHVVLNDTIWLMLSIFPERPTTIYAKIKRQTTRKTNTARSR